MSSKKGTGLILLRAVNLLRRKIVRSEHSKLAGLSLLLLSKLFPVSERSGIVVILLFNLIILGVNLKGERNLDNNNLKCTNEYSKQEHSCFLSVHDLFYHSPSKLADREIWSKFCVVNQLIT